MWIILKDAESFALRNCLQDYVSILFPAWLPPVPVKDMQFTWHSILPTRLTHLTMLAAITISTVSAPGFLIRSKEMVNHLEKLP